MDIHDHYFRLAKREGYRSRAAYKLIEIDDRRQILRPGQRVLDCGCAPGAWLQVAARRIGPRGLVLGVDLKAVGPPLPEENVRTVVADVCEVPPAELLRHLAGAGRGPERARFDVILSDMAPSTSGARSSDHHASLRLCERLLDLCPALLREGGALVMKVFEGEGYPDLLRRAKGCFERVKGFQPRASREGSTEMYLIAQGFEPAGAAGGAAPDADHPALAAAPRRPPAAGWGERKSGS